MYADDMPVIRDYGRATPEAMAHVVTFVLCTIQKPFERMAVGMADIAAKGADSSYLFGFKRDGYRFIQSRKAEVFRDMHLIISEGGLEVRERIIDLFMQVPGLGIAKAAFVGQLLGFETSCLDSHNLARLGMAEGAFRYNAKAKPETIRAKVRAYLAVCDRFGTSEQWWDSWCEHVATTRTRTRKVGTFKDAQEVSHLHRSALGLP